MGITSSHPFLAFLSQKNEMWDSRQIYKRCFSLVPHVRKWTGNISNRLRKQKGWRINTSWAVFPPTVPQPLCSIVQMAQQKMSLRVSYYTREIFNRKAFGPWDLTTTCLMVHKREPFSHYICHLGTIHIIEMHRNHESPLETVWKTFFFFYLVLTLGQGHVE